MAMLSALLALCEGNPPVTGGFPSQRASDDVFVDVSLNKSLNKPLSASDLRCHDAHVMLFIMRGINFNIKTFSTYKHSHDIDKPVMKLSYLYNENSCTCKIVFYIEMTFDIHQTILI